MLAKNQRFHGHGSLKYVFTKGRSYHGPIASLRVTPNSRRSESRAAVVVSKKVHKSAAGRNRIRRRIYEIIRHELPKTLPKHDIVIIVSSADVRMLPATDVYIAVHRLFDDAGLYQKPAHLVQ